MPVHTGKDNRTIEKLLDAYQADFIFRIHGWIKEALLGAFHLCQRRSRLDLKRSVLRRIRRLPDVSMEDFIQYGRYTHLYKYLQILEGGR